MSNAGFSRAAQAIQEFDFSRWFFLRTETSAAKANVADY
jgi:hypothetical protein